MDILIYLIKNDINKRITFYMQYNILFILS